MENASKALIMAAGILIGLLVISLGIYLAVIFGNYASTTQEQLQNTRMAAFNDDYMKYDGRTDLTIQDIITVKNKALENNMDVKNGSYDKQPGAGDNNDLIDVYLGTTEANALADLDTNFILGKDDNALLEAEVSKSIATGSYYTSTKYTCKVFINSTTARVYKVYFYNT